MEARTYAPLIFDFDDTLIVSRSDRAHVLLEALALFGVTTSPELMDQFWGRPFRELVCGIAPDVDARYEQFISHYSEVLRAHPPTACPGVLETLPDLAVMHRVFVHSASSSRLVRTDLQSLGILHLVDFVCGSDWQLVSKPDPGSFGSLTTLLGSAEIDYSKAWYVGDAETDAEIAARAGLKFVGVAYDKARRSRFLDKGVPEERIIDSMEALPMVIDVPS